MPLNFAQVNEYLSKNKDKFEKFTQEYQQELDILTAATQSVFNMSYHDIMQQIASISNCGAIPSEEYKQGLLIPCNRFKNIKDLRSLTNWAVNHLRGNTVVGSDGSQIYPSSEYSIPVSVVQVAWFRNFHRPGEKYEKLTRVDILSPEELLVRSKDKKTKVERVQIGEEPVNAKRFEMEMEVLKEQINFCKNHQIQQPSFFISDGSLILSFIAQIHEPYKSKHWDVLRDALDTAEYANYPMIGYVDSSDAKDVANMIRTIKANTLNDVKYISDASLLESYLYQLTKSPLNLGDRTCCFICRRGDEIYQDLYYSTDKTGKKHEIAFFYIKLSSSQIARIEIPVWILQEEGLVDQIADIFLAQSILGAGYPYLTDQCHHHAVIEGKDRKKFYGVFQKYTEEWAIDLKIKNKAKSKMRRY